MDSPAFAIRKLNLCIYLAHACLILAIPLYSHLSPCDNITYLPMGVPGDTSRPIECIFPSFHFRHG